MEATSDETIKVPSFLVLTAGEAPVWSGRQAYRSFAGSTIFGALLVFFGLVVSLLTGSVFLLALFAVLGIFVWLLVVLYVISSEYFVSNERVFVKYGILDRKSTDLKLEWITGTVVSQGLFGRLLGVGNIRFTGAGPVEVGMRGVSNVLALKETVEVTIQKNRGRGQALPPVMQAAIQETKFCQSCGARMPSTAGYCPSCGRQQP